MAIHSHACTLHLYLSRHGTTTEYSPVRRARPRVASFGHGTLSVYCEYVSYCRRKAYHDRMMLRVALIHITYIYIHSTTYCGIMLASPMLQPRCAAYFLLDQAGQRGLPGGVFERSLLPASSSYLRGLRGVWRLVHWQGRRCKRE